MSRAGYKTSFRGSFYLPFRHQSSCMFARRKHDDSEDEPLVPHGFLWQATEEPQAESRGASAPITPAQPIATSQPQPATPNFRAPAPSSQVSDPRLDSGVEKLGAISPPIPWPSPRTTSVIRRVTPAAFVPSKTQPFTAEHRGESQSPPIQRNTLPTTPVLPVAQTQNRKVEVIELENQEEFRSALRESLQQILPTLRQHYLRTRAGIARLSTQIRDGGHSIIRSINATVRIERIGGMAAGRVQKFKAMSGLLRKSAVSTWNSNLPRIASMASLTGRSASQVTRASLLRAADVGRRMQNYRIRVRVASSPMIEKLTRRSKMVWLARRNAFRRQPRMWTSMAMAALSALLTMGLISGVRSYGPESNASGGNTAEAMKNQAGPTGLIAPRTALADNPVVKRPSPATKIAALPKPSAAVAEHRPTALANKNPGIRRVHHSADEDYVAPDTFHYYGKNGSR